MTENEQKRKNLEAMLKKEELVFEFAQLNNIEEPILLIKDYPKGQKKNKVSFAFSLADFYNGIFNFGAKYWMTAKNIKSINGDMPNPYPTYKEFEYEQKRYFPFSAQLQRYGLENINSIRSICRDLYNHIDFQNDQ